MAGSMRTSVRAQVLGRAARRGSAFVITAAGGGSVGAGAVTTNGDALATPATAAMAAADRGRDAVAPVWCLPKASATSRTATTEATAPTERDARPRDRQTVRCVRWVVVSFGTGCA